MIWSHIHFKAVLGRENLAASSQFSIYEHRWQHLFPERKSKTAELLVWHQNGPHLQEVSLNEPTFLVYDIDIPWHVS